ncbi:hypothetical protein [Dokdonella sp.]|uniref:hypothetical protein n=1 Tax=Dokdonella sp. TaxID=2291710 RepID=UPI002F3F62A9
MLHHPFARTRAVVFAPLLAAASLAVSLAAAAPTALPHGAVVAGSAGWTQQAKLLADVAANNDYAGRAVAISGDTAVVGAAGADVGGNDGQGAAFVYVRSGGTWTQQARLVADDGAAGDEFGFALAISGDRIVVGARFAAIGAAAGQGAAYVFERTGATWTQQAKLAATDGAAFDGFGNAVAIDGDTLVVGAQNAAVNGNMSQGAAYVYGFGGGWNLESKLSASDGAAWVQFGRAVSVRGDSVLVGAVSAAVGANQGQGAAYVYTRAGGSWGERARLVASDGEAWDGFGGAVSLDAGQAIIGASSNGMAGEGAAYVFVGSGADWSEQGKLVAGDAFNGDGFGTSVALSGGVAIAGSLFSDLAAAQNAGAAYVFTRTGGAWSQQAKLVADDASDGAEFGLGAALDGTTALIGAEFASGADGWPGAGYVFDSGAGTCTTPLVEAFDGIVAPALPSGWSVASAQGTNTWLTVVDAADSAPNAAFAADPSSPSDTTLEAPPFVPLAGATLAFRQHYDLEPTYDGAVLEIAIAGAPYVDFVDAGGSFSEGGYADTMIGTSAIAGRAAWTGDSGGWITTRANYPPSAIGQPVRLRWRIASDVSAARNGWWIDTVSFGCSDVPQALAQVSPLQFSFTLAAGAAASDTLHVGNVGDAGSVLSFAIGESKAACDTATDLPWLAATPAGGDVAGTASADVTIGVDASGLVAGTYTATLCVQTSDASHATVAVPVTLDVAGSGLDLIFSDGFDTP